ncbi:MAG: hypothetical protein B7Z02_10755 [Rhodobacterales bacterium 32-67-9]|nr:MAG: hypothetical protein B7Z02_10755 [Rhodobacterales bacterium 32-67-9]
MHRFAPIAALLSLAACAAPVAAPDPSPLGDVQIGTDIYPIEATEAGTWRVKVGGHPVVCAKPNQEACYWSVRNYLTAQELLDDLG